MVSSVTRTRLRTAWVVAVLVDGLQMVTAPTEVTGPMAWLLDVGLDLVTMGVMILLVGFHWAFLPSFVTKLLPFVDLAPIWTLALFIAGAKQASPSSGASSGVVKAASRRDRQSPCLPPNAIGKRQGW